MNYKSYDSGHLFLIGGLLMFLFFGGLKTILSILPALFSVLPGLLIGLLVFFIMKKALKNQKIGQSFGGNYARTRFVELLIRILIHAVKADGKIDQRETQTIENFFRVGMRYNDTQMIWVKDLIQHALKENTPLDDLCHEFRSQFMGDARLMVLGMVYQVMASDHTISQSEQLFINDLVKKLGITEEEHTQVRGLYTNNPESSENYYEILGLQPGASQEEIKKAYKEACKKHHPDKVQHLGEEFRKEAEVKFKKINEAYNHLAN